MTVSVPFHAFKTDKEPFKALWSGEKKSDVRDLSDRPKIGPGSLVMFWEHDRSVPGAKYTGRRILARVTHVQTGYSLGDTVAVLSLVTLWSGEEMQDWPADLILEDRTRALIDFAVRTSGGPVAPKDPLFQTACGGT